MRTWACRMAGEADWGMPISSPERMVRYTGCGAAEDVVAAEAEDVELVKVILRATLIPLQTPNVLHRRANYGHGIRNWIAGDHDSRGVSPHIARNILHHLGEFENKVKPLAGDVAVSEFGLGLDRGFDTVRTHATMNSFRQIGKIIGRNPEYFADLSNDPAGVEGSNRANRCHMVGPVLSR